MHYMKENSKGIWYRANISIPRAFILFLHPTFCHQRPIYPLLAFPAAFVRLKNLAVSLYNMRTIWSEIIILSEYSKKLISTTWNVFIHYTYLLRVSYLRNNATALWSQLSVWSTPLSFQRILGQANYGVNQTSFLFGGPSGSDPTDTKSNAPEPPIKVNHAARDISRSCARVLFTGCWTSSLAERSTPPLLLGLT